LFASGRMDFLVIWMHIRAGTVTGRRPLLLFHGQTGDLSVPVVGLGQETKAVRLPVTLMSDSIDLGCTVVG
jgi:hypothetical protein